MESLLLSTYGRIQYGKVIVWAGFYPFIPTQQDMSYVLNYYYDSDELFMFQQQTTYMRSKDTKVVTSLEGCDMLMMGVCLIAMTDSALLELNTTRPNMGIYGVLPISMTMTTGSYRF